MRSQENTYSFPGLGNFSLDLMQADSDDRKSATKISDEGFAKSTLNEVVDDQLTWQNENRNLSSVIKRIRDDESAFTRSDRAGARQRNYGRKGSAKFAETMETVQEWKTVTQSHKNDNRGLETSILKDQAALSRRLAFHNNHRERGNIQTHKNKWQKFIGLLVLVISGIASFFIYQLQIQVNGLKDSIYSYEEQVLVIKSRQKQASDILSRISNMSIELGSLEKELDTIKLGYRNFDNSFAVNIPDNHELNASSGEHEIKTAVETKDVIISTVEDVVSNTEQIIPGIWVVNLASLSSREQAQKEINNLRDSGISPIIQEAVVNNVKVYRLCVSGFATHKKALVFIREAREKYGFDGSWIRRS